MKELTPAEKREQTMIEKYGPDWRQRNGKKAAETYRKNHTPERRKEIASNAGKIGGKNSPTKFTKGDPRAVRFGKLKKPRADLGSENSE